MWRGSTSDDTMKLEHQRVDKPWGRVDLSAPFDGAGRTGEIWFDPVAPATALLVKFIFTSERLSIQVHPDDDQARARGLANGKTECWYIVDAEPGATIGIGLRRSVDAAALRAAALDGAIVDLLDWRPVVAGDFLFVPAGTVHAIGGGITLIEVQQTSDVTYRLYDYGRPRELHLDDGIAVARTNPDAALLHRHAEPGPLVEAAAFGVWLAEATTGGLPDRDRWVIPLSGHAVVGTEVARFGECLFVCAGDRLDLSDDARVLIAAA